MNGSVKFADGRIQEFMANLKNIYIRFDWAIKKLLRQKANFSVLEGFVSVFIGVPIKIVEILESEGNQSRIDDKYNRVDIKALNDKGEIILIEIQNTRETYYMERMLYGVAKTITEHIDLGDPYSKVKKVYSINIVYFELGIGKDYIYRGQNKFIGLNTGDELKIRAKEKDMIVTKESSEIFPEYIIIRVKEFDKDIADGEASPIEEWIEYLKSGKIMPDATAPGLAEARARLQYESMSPAEQKAYRDFIDFVVAQDDAIATTREEGHAEGRLEGFTEGKMAGIAEGMAKGMAKGIEQGRVQGAANERYNMAKSMKAEGLSVDLIAKITNLTAEEIASI